MRILNDVLLENGDVTLTLNSDPLLLAHSLGFAIQAVFTGTPAGELKLQGSNDPVPDAQFTETPPTNWTDIDGSTATITGAGTVLINNQGVYFNWVRAVYTPDVVPGTGTLSIRGNAKGF